MVDPATIAGIRLLRVPDGPSGRVDRYVADATGLSRSYVQKLISDGRLTSAGELLKANTIVGAGTELRFEVPEAVPLNLVPAPEIVLRVVYEDEDLLIIDKPAGLVVHPAPGHPGGTLVNALLAHGDGATWGGIAGVQRPGIVHRLDRDTSGLLMVARRDLAQASLMAQLKARRIKKTYQALVQGRRRSGRADRGADRARPEAPDQDGGRPRRDSLADERSRPQWAILGICALFTRHAAQCRGDRIGGGGDRCAACGGGKSRRSVRRCFDEQWQSPDHRAIARRIERGQDRLAGRFCYDPHVEVTADCHWHS